MEIPLPQDFDDGDGIGNISDHESYQNVTKDEFDDGAYMDDEKE